MNNIMTMRFQLVVLQCVAAGWMALFSSAATADVYINEIFFNPPNPPLGEDSAREYIELRGTPGMSLANHYLIFVDTPINNGFGTAGVIQHIFNLNNSAACPSGCSLGSNGYLTIRQKGSGYTVATGTTNLINTGSGVGFGSGFSSSVGSTDANANGEI